MTARILAVDDVAANLKILKARLAAQYYDVVTASDGQKAIDICRDETIDLVLLDILMPGLNGFEVCRYLKSDPRTMHIPVIMLTALSQQEDRVRGLNAGADDFLTKPVREIQLIARVKSLVRLKTMTDELRARARTAADVGIDKLLHVDPNIEQRKGSCLLFQTDQSSRQKISAALCKTCDVEVTSDPERLPELAANLAPELIMIETQSCGCDPLRLCSQLRSREATRFVPLLLICGEGEDDVIARALDLGVDDCLMRPLDVNELVARCRTQIKRKRYHDRLRESVRDSIAFSVTDPLTGLFNRRYLDNNIEKLAFRSRERETPLSLLVIDIDRFKSINDTYGHDAGDRVLTEFSRRIREVTRKADLVCRVGGEEFVIVLPDTTLKKAGLVAERLRECVGGEPYAIRPQEAPLKVTASIGLSQLRKGEQVSDLIKRADAAMLAAKSSGRNRVKAEAA